MTKEEIIKVAEAQQQYADALRAVAEGKPIQVRRGSGKWEDANLDNFEFCPNSFFQFRVKTEQHYRPFKNQEEFLAAAQKHGFWMQTFNSRCTKQDFEYVFPVTIYRFGFYSIDEDGDYNRYDYDNIIKCFVWKDDNTPCGVLIEELEDSDDQQNFHDYGE